MQCMSFSCDAFPYFAFLIKVIFLITVERSGQSTQLVVLLQNMQCQPVVSFYTEATCQTTAKQGQRRPNHTVCVHIAQAMGAWMVNRGHLSNEHWYPCWPNPSDANPIMCWPCGTVCHSGHGHRSDSIRDRAAFSLLSELPSSPLISYKHQGLTVLFEPSVVYDINPCLRPLFT